MQKLKYNRSLEKHALAHFQRTTCSQIYFRFSSYLLRKPLLIRSTAFICNIDHVLSDQSVQLRIHIAV
jgi:hypothetical protein